MFLLKPSDAGIQKLEDCTGNWIDVHEAQKVVDQAQDRISELRDELGVAKGEYDRAANKVEALQQRLNTAEQRTDELESAVSARFEEYVATAVDQSPEVVRRLGEYLTRVLSEDHWLTVEPMLLAVSTITAKQQ
jgi:predicted nuclease with TOPRIM domain